MDNSQFQNQLSFVQQDECDCDRRCPKCGKLKRQATPYWGYQPYWQQPYIVYTTTGSGCGECK